MGLPNPALTSGLRFFAAATTSLMIASVIVAASPAPSAIADTAPPVATTPETASSDALATAQINGVAWDQVIIGNTVYVGGNFSTARPSGAAPGTGTVTRTHLLAYSLSTGALLPWAPTVNAQVRSLAASPDGTRLYVGGDFTTVNGAPKNRLAAFDTASGTLVGAFQASANSPVYAVTATNTTVYFGGQFSQTRGVARQGAAAATAASGAITDWAPAIQNGRVFDMVVSPTGDKIAIGGSFTTVNGSSNPGYGLAGVDSSLGALIPWSVNNQVRNAGKDAAIFSLATDGDSVYGTGYHFGPGGTIEGTFRADWANGDLKWMADCHGDTYSVAPAGDTIYTTGHAHYCGNIDGPPQTEPWSFTRALAFSKNASGVNKTDPYGYPDWTGTAKPELLNWYPTINSGTFTGQAQGGWSVAANSQYVVYGGEFTQINGRGQQGLVRFAVKSIAPNLDGPRLSGGNFVPTLDSPSAGTVRVSWPANWDRDNEKITYNVIRDGRSGTPVYVTEKRSTFWDRPNIVFLDSGLTPGQNYTYRLRAIDPMGNSAWGSTLNITASTTGSLSAYAKEVLEDQPTSYWRLGDTPGTSSALDSGAADRGTVNSGATFGQDGAIIGDVNTAAAFSGDSSGFIGSSTQGWRDDTLSVEAWFKTTTTSGGKIVGFGNRNSGDSSAYDRHVYMNSAGKILFGAYPGASRTVASSKSFNDGQWHHVVASLGADGMSLYIDAKKVASNPDVTNGQQYWGYWRIGGDNSWSGNPYFAGTIDEVAVYPAPLSQERIAEHYTASGRVSSTPSQPADTYGAAVYAQNPLLYWRLGESSGTTAMDSGQLENSGLYSGEYKHGAPTGITGTADTAVDFASGVVASSESFDNPTTYSTEIWFSTTTTRGGKLTGFGNAQSGLSSGYDRHVYMQDDGRLVFGTYTGQLNLITTDVAFNDGEWHHAVATQSSSGMRFYVDGKLMGTNPQTGAENYTGFWRIGGDRTWGSSSEYFDGVLDEFAVYAKALTPTVVQAHYELGMPTAPNEAPIAAFEAVGSGLAVKVDAAKSIDPDGTISSYSWNFGDGTTAVGVAASHTYAAGGTYTVALTVTDNDGSTATTTRIVTANAPNVAPIAEFTSAANGLTVVFDATGSTDSDGTIQSYAWAFGDDAVASGATARHTFAASASYEVTLTVTDDDGLTNSRSATIVVSAANVAPTASFSSRVADLIVSVDAAASSDSDGTIAGYAWNFGDGVSGTGVTATHLYATAGQYTVTLVVTDDDGATSTTNRTVEVAAPPASSLIAEDAFERVSGSGLGTAEPGGPWTSAINSSHAVNNGTAVFTHTPGSTRRAALDATSSTDIDIVAGVSADKAATGGGHYAGLVGRKVGTDYYQVRTRFLVGGVIAVQALRGPSTVLANATVSGLTYVPSTQLTMRVQVIGTSPTTIRAKVWPTGTAEPASWHITTTDSSASLQVAGSVGLQSYLSASATNAPIAVRFDNFIATTASASPPPPPPANVAPANVAPVASFTWQAEGLVGTFSAATSTDSDGTIVGSAWSFGDATTGSGTSASHTYASAGTYSVVLTVTDDDGASHSVAGSITVTAPVVAPEPGAPIGTDTFDRAIASGWGASNTGAVWNTAANGSYSVSSGSGAFLHTAGSTRRALLTGISDTSVEVAVTVASDKPTSAGHIVAGIVGRQVGAEFYQGRARLLPGGSVALQLMRGSSTVLANSTITGLTYAPGDALHLKVQVTGTSPTSIRGKVWRVGTPEPAGWQLTATDSTAALQAPGSVGVESYISGSATNAPITLRYDDFVVTHIE